MKADAVSKINSRHIDWQAGAALALGHLEKAEYLADVCKKHHVEEKVKKESHYIELTATGGGLGGKPIEALGSRLNGSPLELEQSLQCMDFQKGLDFSAVLAPGFEIVYPGSA